MKKRLILMMVSVLATPLFAQDIIVTAFGDTIQCQIIRMDDNSVTYQLVRNDGSLGGTAIIARQFVSDYRFEQKNVESHEEIEELEAKQENAGTTANTGSNQIIISTYGITKPKPEYTTFRWAFAAGYARRLSKIPELKGELKNNKNYGAVFENLVNGFSWETELQYFFNKNHGLALNVSGVHAFASQNGTTTIPRAYRQYFYDLKLRQSMIYIGPAWANKFEIKNFLFSSSLSLGFLINSEKHWPNGKDINMDEIRHSVAGGINCGIGGEYKISSVYAMGIKIGTTLDSISLFNIGNINKPLIPVSWSSFVVAVYLSFRN